MEKWEATWEWKRTANLQEEMVAVVDITMGLALLAEVVVRAVYAFESYSHNMFIAIVADCRMFRNFRLALAFFHSDCEFLVRSRSQGLS